MAAPPGAEVSIYVDSLEHVAIGDVVETTSGRRYCVLANRVQGTGKHSGRQHLRAVVLAPGDAVLGGPRTHRIRWYRRRKRGGR
jgi:hypothetical protein